MNWKETKERIERLDPWDCRDKETAACLKLLVEYMDKYVWRVPDSSRLSEGKAK